MITRAACRLRSPIACSPTSYLHSFTRLLYSSPPPASHAGTPTAGQKTDGGSVVYRKALKYARPSTVTWTERLHNSVSFIGTVEYPPKQFATKNGDFGVWTVLRVKTSPNSKSSFCIHLSMWDEIAQRALQYLKPNDYIYVSGQLGAYTKTALNGIERFRYKVTATEFNYVKRGEPEVHSQRIVNSESGGESRFEKNRSRLHLWQIFFADPSEWYDRRKTKHSPTHPDFMHKSTGEALWLHDGNPEWVKKQLELLDSRLPRGPRNHVTSEFLSSR